MGGSILKKKLTVLTLILALALGLTGCVGGELKLYDAFNKMQDITSLDTDMEMTFTFETEGFSEEEQMVLQQISAMLNNAKVKTHQRQVLNEEQTVVKAEMNTIMDFGGMTMDMGLWVDMDLTEDEQKMVEIIKMPQMLMSFISPEDPAKEYIVYDLGEMMKAEDVELNFAEIMEFSKELQPKLAEFMKEIQKDFKPGFKVVTQKDDKVVNGKKLEIYEVKLDDATLKELVKYAVNYSLEDEKTLEFFKEYMDAVMSMGMIPEEEREAAEKEIAEGFKEFENQIPEMKEKFNEFMEKYKDVEILGDKGIVVEYGIDDKGYIVHEAGNMDLKIDLGKIAEVLEEDTEMQGIIKLGIDFKSEYYNINNKIIRVNIPKVNENNSLNMMDIMEQQMEAIPEPESVEPAVAEVQE